MAANEERCSLWRTPLSTPVRTNENGIQDLFRHSEKLLASAVSICRLKGSVECQTGGLITVCEEMQRLLRLAFSENARIEKEMKKQKQNYEEDISLLKERVSYLENEKELLKKGFKDLTSKNNEGLQSELLKQGNVLTKVKPTGKKFQEENKKMEAETKSVTLLECTENASKHSEKNESSKENVKPEVKAKEKKSDGKVFLEDIAVETTDNSENFDDSSLEILYLESPKASKTKSKSSKGSLNKVGKKAVSRKERLQNIINEEAVVLNDNVQEKKDKAESVVDSNNSSRSRRSSRRSVADASDKEAESIRESPDVMEKESVSVSVHLNPDTGLIETTESEEEPVEKQTLMKPKRNTKKKDVKKNIKGKISSRKNQIEDFKEPKCETNKQKILDGKSKVDQKSVDDLPRNGSSSSMSDDHNDARNSINTIPDDNQEEILKSVNSKTTKTPEKEEEDEVLGDVSFLIEISSMITALVGNPDSTQLELPLMTARERADARKLAAIFNLHISIGSKMDNRSSLVLSKTSNTKMPKPGKLDNLLSLLSIAAAKETDRAKSKSRTKRKLSSTPDGGCNEEENKDDSRPKRNIKTLSRSKKARM